MNPTSRNDVWKVFECPDWKYKRKYQVSCYGGVKKILKNPTDKEVKIYILGGYETFSEKKKNGKTDLIYVHRLVAKLFLEQDAERKFVIHKDFNKLNNNAENLKFVNRQELVYHNMNNPTIISKKKEAYFMPKYSKLNVGKVRMIKRKIFDPKRTTRMKMIAKQFGISEMQLYRIKSGENWGHVTDY